MPCVKIFEDDERSRLHGHLPAESGPLPRDPEEHHARNLIEFPADRLGGLFAAVQKLSKAVVKALNCDGVIVTQFNGAPAGQTVFHLHVHVIPRYANLPLQPHHGGKTADMTVLRDQAARIAAAL
jgi:histidine triad (HIT) family protein